MSNGKLGSIGERVCLLAVGTCIAVSPAPESIKVPIAKVAYIAGMLGFAIKEALGGQTTANI